MSNKFIMVDLFSGVGGLSCGFMMKNYDPIFANDFDLEIGNSYKHNHPNVRFYPGDISELNFNEIKKECDVKPGEIDVIVGGPPCQGYSMANRKRIENDPRNFLFLEFVKCVKIFQPKCFLIENVMGINTETNNDNGVDIPVVKTISQYFNEMGYAIKLTSFKSEEYGVPQYRRRMMVIGTNIRDKKILLKNHEIGILQKTHNSLEQVRRNKDKQQLSMDVFNTNEFPNPPTVWDALSDLPQFESGGGGEKLEYHEKPLNEYQRILRKDSSAVYNHKSTPHNEEALKRIRLIKQGKNFESLPDDLKTTSVHSGAYGRLEADFFSPTITTRFDTPSTGRVIHPFSNRTLTVREAARIQSFPDTYIFCGSRTSQGKQVGNAVPPLVAKKIAEMFIRDFLS